MRELGRPVIHPWHCDQFGHMNVRWYAHFFDDANFSLWHASGLNVNAWQEEGVHTVVAETRTRFLRECLAGEGYVIRGVFTSLTSRSICSHLRMYHADTDVVHAQQDVVEVFFDANARSSMAAPEEMRAVLELLVVKDLPR
jgi:acyl-CoA thioester hydrolase